VNSVTVGPEARVSPLKDRESFLSALSFRSPEKIVSSSWLEHAPFAFWLVEMLRPRILVELGTHNGFSYFAFCQAIRMAGLSAAAFAVDHWTGDENAGFYGEDVFQGVEAYNGEQYSDISTLMKMAFADALQYFEDGSVDLLHIDGRHHFDDVKANFESWLPKLSPRAVVLFHDTNLREREFGAHRFWSEVCRQYPNFSFLHGHGLGVLGVGKRCPSRVAALFNASADETLTASVRNAYARLGRAVTLAFGASEAWQLRAAAAQEADALRSECDLLRVRQGEILADLAARAGEVERALGEALRDKESLSQTLAASVTERDALRKECARIAAELQSRQQQLAEKAAASAELAARADHAERALGEAARDKESLSQTLAASVAEGDALREERVRIAAELQSRQQELAEKATALADLDERHRVTEANHAAAAEEAGALRTEREALRQRMAELADEQSRLQAEAEETAAELKEELERASTMLSAERQRAAEQTDRLADLEERQRFAEANHAAAAQEAGELRNEREALRQRIAELADEQSRLQAEAEQTAAELKDELERAFTMLSAERQRAAEQTDQLADLEERQEFALAELAARADQAERALGEAARDQEALSQALAASVAELADTRRDFAEVARKHGDALAALELAQAEKDKISADLAAAWTEAAAYKESADRDAADARRTIEELTDYLNQRDAEIVAANLARSEALGENEELGRALQQIKREKAAALQRLAISVTERDALREDRARIAAELQSRQRELAKKAAASAELAARADQAVRDKDALSQTLAASVAQRDALRKDRARIAAELQSRQRELAEKAAASAELAARADQAVREKESLSQALAASVAELADTRRDFAEVARKHGEALAALELAQAEKDKISADLAVAWTDAAAHKESADRDAADARRTIEELTEGLGRRDAEIEAANLQKLAVHTADLASMNSMRIEAERKAQDLTHILDAMQSRERELHSALTEMSASREQSNKALDEANAKRVDLARNLDLALQRVQQVSTERASAHEAAHAQALAEAQKAHEAQIHALRGQLVDAEAALSNSTAKQSRAGILARLLPPVFRRRLLARQLVRSGLLDAEWYSATYPDVAESGLGAAEHYLEKGFCRGYRPNPFFDTRWYLERYEDVRLSGVNPLLHYLMNGVREGRDPGPGFQTDFYLETNPDVRANRMNPLTHYLRYGRHEGRPPVRPA
jgi:chromosome segregation ATPase